MCRSSSRLSSNSPGQLAEELPNRPNLIFRNDTDDLDDWRTPILWYSHIQTPKLINVQRSAEFVLHHELYQKNCRRPVAEVFRIWSSTDCYGRSLWTLIKLIKKKIGDNTMRWPKILFEALWAYCIFRNGARCIKPCRQVDEEQQARGHQVEVFIEWSKWYLAILIC